MTTATDAHDLLVDSCGNHANYPRNLLRGGVFGHALDSYSSRLADHRDRLFDGDPNHTVVDFLEVYDGDETFQSTSARNLASLRLHLEANRKDPRCRHAFIQADTSRSPLDCSFEMFAYLLTFQQVMASFLDLVFCFGKTKLPMDFHYTAFRSESFLSCRDSNRFEIPRLGRSGRDFRLCYNLWSVERVPESAGGPPWSIRQTAVFHSFDITNGRTFWLTIKANDLLQKRIIDATKSFGPLQARSLKDLQGLFAATLLTHLVFLEWCNENWRWYISKLGDDLRKIRVKLTSAPIEDVEKALALDVDSMLSPINPIDSSPPNSPLRATTLKFPKSNSLPRRDTMASERFTVTSPLKNLYPQRLDSATMSTSPTSFSPIDNAHGPLGSTQTNARDDSLSGAKSTVKQLEILNQFSFDELQNIHQIASRLNEAALVVKLNMEILGEIQSYYTELGQLASIRDEIQLGCRDDLSSFVQRVKSILRDLGMEHSRLEALMRLANDGMALFDDILQYRSTEYNKIFTVTARQSSIRVELMTQDMHDSSQRMEDMTIGMHKIADKTERETASMHIITLVTLVFLPGTFVATFFGSGLFQWESNTSADLPTWKPHFFGLFLKVFLPLTAATLLIWLAVFLWARRKDPNKGDLEQAPGTVKHD